MGGTSVVVAKLGGAVHQHPVPPIANKPVFDDAQWVALTEGLNSLGGLRPRTACRYGITTTWVPV